MNFVCKLDITELNRKVNIPVILTRLGADPNTIKRLGNKNDYRCPCWVRGGDNSHGMGITFHSKREKWLLSDFTHGTFGNIDLIDFAIKFCGYTFKTALKLMEECCGVELRDINTSYNSEYEVRNYELPNSILDLFEYGCHPYMYQRGYLPSTIEHFGIGYSAIGDLEDRIIIPIVDENGKLISIQGRSFTGDELRYLFIDGTGSLAKETLYNLFNAKKAIQEKGWVLVVEGAMSVFRAYQYGIKNCVATLSTSVTDKQLRLLKSLNVKVVLAFDFDKDTQAGQFATIKTARKLKELGIENGVYTLNIGVLGLEGAIDDLSPSEVKQALKTIKKLF